MRPWSRLLWQSWRSGRRRSRWGRESGTWMWAWANSGIPPPMREQSALLTIAPDLAGRAELHSESPVEATEQDA